MWGWLSLSPLPRRVPSSPRHPVPAGCAQSRGRFLQEAPGLCLLSAPPAVRVVIPYFCLSSLRPKLWNPGGQEPHLTCLCVPITPDNGPGTQSTRNRLWNERVGLFPAVTPFTVTTPRTAARVVSNEPQRAEGLGRNERQEGEFLGKAAEDLGRCTVPPLLLVDKTFRQWTLSLN